MSEIVAQFTFNTGRQYSAEGQVITCGFTDEGDLVFNDHSRCVYGKVKHNIVFDDPNFDSDPLGTIEVVMSDVMAVRDAVMDQYDNGAYEWHPLAGGLTRGGK